MSALSRQRLRIALDTAKTGPSIILSTGGVPLSWKGFDAQFEFAVFFGSCLQDVSDLQSITLEIKPDITTTAVLTATTTGINTALTLAQWQAGTDQHVTFDFTALQMNQPVAQYYCAVYALTAEGYRVPLGWFNLDIKDLGAGVDGTPPTPPDVYITAAQADARYPQAVAFNIPAGYRIAADPTTYQVYLEPIP